MNIALMQEIMAAQKAADGDRVDALLTEILQDVDLNDLPDELVERYLALLEDEAAAVPADSVERVLARLAEGGEEFAPAPQGEQYPRLIDCLERSLENDDDLGELGLDAPTLETIRRDPRPVTQPPQSLKCFGAWLTEGEIRMPETLQQRVMKRVRRTFLELAPRHDEEAVSLQAARKENRRT